MRIYALFFILPLFLVSCTLPGTQTETSENTVIFENDALSVSVPKNWTEASTRSIPTPKKGIIELAYIAPDTKYGFANNFVIMSHELETPITSEKYAELNQLQTSRNYLEYTKLTDKNFSYTDDEVSHIYTFEARYNESSPRMKFIQTARVCGTKVYLLHFSLALEKDPELYIPLLQTFRCK